MGRPLNGIGAPAQVPSPFLASAQLSNMKFTLDSVTPSLTVPAQNLTVSSLPPPAALTPAQQIARDRAQALLTKLGQSAGIVPLAGSASNKQSKTIRIK